MTTDSGVSPVISVLLMLTLTLIIAAIVNSFAGGLVDTKEKPPSATLQATFHQNRIADPNNASLLITHVSGDPLPVSDISIILRPTRTFGDDAENNFIEIGKANITNSRTYSETWANGITSMKVGDTHGVFGDTNISKLNGKYDLMAEKYQGNTVYLEFYYDRNLIAKPEVLIQG
jgi:FlaG/FlaF family flagellin (archaellin)